MCLCLQLFCWRWSVVYSDVPFIPSPSTGLHQNGENMDSADRVNLVWLFNTMRLGINWRMVWKFHVLIKRLISSLGCCHSFLWRDCLALVEGYHDCSISRRSPFPTPIHTQVFCQQIQAWLWETWFDLINNHISFHFVNVSVKKIMRSKHPAAASIIRGPQSEPQSLGVATAGSHEVPSRHGQANSEPFK